jgi:hypothetical protein
MKDDRREMLGVSDSITDSISSSLYELAYEGGSSKWDNRGDPCGEAGADAEYAPRSVRCSGAPKAGPSRVVRLVGVSAVRPFRCWLDFLDGSVRGTGLSEFLLAVEDPFAKDSPSGWTDGLARTFSLWEDDDCHRWYVALILVMKRYMTVRTIRGM